MIKRLHVAFTAALSLLVLTPAIAADNLPAKDAAGAAFSYRSKDLGSRLMLPMHLPATVDGVPISATNPLSVTLPSGQVVTLASGASVSVSNFPATQVISSLALGSPGDTAWDGTAANASITAILKGLPRTSGGAGGSVVVTSGTISLPAGASTFAAQSTGNTSLASIDGKLPALVTGRTPVDGSGVTQPVSIATLPLGTGASTAALQTTGNTSLASIDTKMPAKGAATAANSQPVTIATDQTAVPVETVLKSTSADRGGTLTTAATAVTLVPANTARRGLAVQNRNCPGASYNVATSVFMSCLGTATQDFHSLEIPAGALYETPSHHAGSGACSFISGTAGTQVYIREF